MARLNHTDRTDGMYDTGDTMRPARQTGLLTRWVPERLKHTALYRWFLRLVRVLQFLSAIISLAIFSSRVYKIYRLVNSFKAYRGIDSASGAVEGILAAAALYTLIAMLMMCLLRGGGPAWLRWLFVVFDILFVGAFIAVATLTRPEGGPAGPKHCYDGRNNDADAGTGNNVSSTDDSCNLPWGTFILAIFSTILHAITAAFNEVKEHHRRNKLHGDKENAMAHRNGHSTDNGHGGLVNDGHMRGNGHQAANGNGYNNTATGNYR